MELASPARMEQAWSVPDVYLLTEGREGAVAVPHLTLTFFDSGLTLDKADGEPVWDSEWAGLTELSPVERSVLPDGREGVVIAVVEREGHHVHRFVLATDDAAAMEAALRDRAAARPARRSRRRAVSRLLTVGIVAAVLATLTVLRLLRPCTPSTSERLPARPARRSATRRATTRRSGSLRTGGSAPRGATTGAGGCPRG